MKSTEAQIALAPPNLMKALLAGFDSIANRIGVILFPIGLDIFLWLGPRLHIGGLLEKAIQQVRLTPGMASPEAAEAFRITREYWLEAARHINLFSALRTYPVGIPSLMAPRQPLNTPFGQAPAFDLASFGSAAITWILLILVGLGLGSLYFMIVARVALREQIEWRRLLSSWPQSSFQVLLLALLWVVLVAAVSIPASCLITLIALMGIGTSSLLIWLYLGMVI